MNRFGISCNECGNELLIDLTEINMIKIAKEIDNQLDKLQIKSEEYGKELREQIVSLCKRIILALREKDGVR